jgi:POT family proton-dependent oligopeptide transporter
LTFVVAGQSGVKPNLSAFVGDQFRKDQLHLIDRVYSLFYVAINVGSAASQIATPWLLVGCGGLCVGSGIAWGFGVPGILMAMSLVIFLIGRKTYIRVPPAGRDANGFGAVLMTRLGKGAAAARAQHGNTAVEGMTSVFRIAGVFAPIIAFWALYFQYGSSWFNQAEAMDLNVFGWHMEAAQMEALNALLILAMVPFFSYVIYPALERMGVRVTMLRRIAAGLFIAVPAFLSAAMIQRWIEAGGHPHIGWQVIQYFIISVSETLVSVTALEFAYTQAPKSMKGAIMSFWFLTIGAGSFVTGVVTRAVSFATQTNYFLFWAAFMLAGAVLFAIVAALYKPVDFVAANETV